MKMTFNATTQNLSDIADRLKTKCKIAESAPVQNPDCKPHIDLAVENGKAAIFLINIAEENRDNIQAIADGQQQIMKKVDRVLYFVGERETDENKQRGKNDPDSSAVFDLKNKKVSAPQWMNQILSAVAGGLVVGLGMYAVTKLFLEDKPVTPRHHVEQPATVKTP
ncbi:MAG: hypothetical protein PHD04_02895 [Candidatus Pacebacteria bacterium]|nr:hypothetical protein [Candidatus Paceibacterota bacterium]